MSVLHKIGAVVAVTLMACSAGYFYGRQAGREAALKAAVSAYQTRERINHETQNMDADAICLALGGVPNQCAALLRGLDTTAQN